MDGLAAVFPTLDLLSNAGLVEEIGAEIKKIAGVNGKACVFRENQYMICDAIWTQRRQSGVSIHVLALSLLLLTGKCIFRLVVCVVVWSERS